MNRLDTNTGKYVWIWEKYRPVILKLMIASSEGPQEYKLSKHEFIDSNNKRPTGYSFTMTTFQGKSEGGTKKSLTAQDLLKMLKYSEKAEKLTLCRSKAGRRY